MYDREFKVPKGQILWETKWNKDGNLDYFVTSDAARSKYYKYRLNAENKPEKLDTAASPKQFK